MNELRALLEEAREDPEVLAILRYPSRQGGDPGEEKLYLVLNPDLRIADLMEKYSHYYKLKSIKSCHLYLRQRILQEGEPVYVRDQKKFAEFVRRTVQEWEALRRQFLGGTVGESNPTRLVLYDEFLRRQEMERALGLAQSCWGLITATCCLVVLKLGLGPHEDDDMGVMLEKIKRAGLLSPESIQYLQELRSFPERLRREFADANWMTINRFANDYLVVRFTEVLEELTENLKEREG